MTQAPWASGPGEILQHGLSLLQEDSDASRRLAMLSIDNSVELMIKTYLGLPKRVTGLTISRSKYNAFSESFPAMLDALEEYASDKIIGVELGDIEWYHRLRNQLYHEGNGLTVEIEKARVYAELAKLLYKNLFGRELHVEGPSPDKLLGHFLAAWVEMEKVVRQLWWPLNTSDREQMAYHFVGNVEDLGNAGIIDHADATEIMRMRAIRNKVVHGAADITGELESGKVDRLRQLTKRLREKGDLETRV